LAEPNPPTTASASHACDEKLLGHVGAGRSAESADDSPTEFVGTTNGEGEQSGEPELEVRPRNVDIMTGDSVNACLYAL
jgi:hypothetical protein